MDRSNSSAAEFSLINVALPDLAIGTSNVRCSQFTYFVSIRVLQHNRRQSCRASQRTARQFMIDTVEKGD